MQLAFVMHGWPSLFLQPDAPAQVCVLAHVTPQPPQLEAVFNWVHDPPQQPWPAGQQDVPHRVFPAGQPALHAVLLLLQPVEGQVIGVGVTHEPREQTDWSTKLPALQLGPEPQFLVGYEQVPSAVPAQAPPQIASLPHDARFPCGWPEATALQMPTKPVISQAMHGLSQAWSQQTPSGAQVVPIRHPLAPFCWHAWPCLLLHAPVVSQVPGQAPGPVSSWFLTAVQTPLEHAWHMPGQSLRCTQPVHWLVAVSHIVAAPLQ